MFSGHYGIKIFRDLLRGTATNKELRGTASNREFCDKTFSSA